jgi:hypothetical protein
MKSYIIEISLSESYLKTKFDEKKGLRKIT